MAGISYVVYNPPRSDFPFLAVMFLPDGEVHARPFRSVAEAEAFNMKMAQDAQAMINAEK